ncbi:hypothetical protein AVEN_66360-1 [Araneus ventricosus]|uniref:Uncharacterized protein n=1 Tax=Araneus ventricosus TaxID=182803 RepID=A0A4Y2VX37_ARAVE|nr:hypothetical protein AVEN_66360-1 [Araneus ventricosus]
MSCLTPSAPQGCPRTSLAAQCLVDARDEDTQHKQVILLVRTTPTESDVTCWSVNKGARQSTRQFSLTRGKLIYGRLTGAKASFLNKTLKKRTKVIPLSEEEMTLLGRIHLQVSMFDVKWTTAANVTLMEWTWLEASGNFIYTGSNIL